MQELLSKAIANFSFFIWTLELLPLDIIVLALTDRDDDPYALRIVVCFVEHFIDIFHWSMLLVHTNEETS